MASLLDNVMSVILGGAVLFLLAVLMLTMRTASTGQTLDTTVQSNLATVTDIIENDFRRVGYKVAVPPSDSAIYYATPDSINMKGDIDSNETVDNIWYYWGKTRPAGNVNPQSRYLYRSVNGVVQVMNDGITLLHFAYFDSLGNQLTASPHVASPSKINSVKVTINLASPFPSQISTHDTTYSYANWEQTLKPRNLKVH
ncbi:MAG TPA: hypothetical protein VI215_01515 [Bacteroidota bacterium]|jgi:hypothetical protein